MSQQPYMIRPADAEGQTPPHEAKSEDLAYHTDTKDADIHEIVVHETTEFQVGETTPEAKAVVSEVDDPTETCESIRAYTLGTIVCIVGTGLNTWFGARLPGIYLNPLLAQFIVHPMGLLCARLLPAWSKTVFGINWTLNPGPWTMKEHTLVTLMATVSLPTATALEILMVVRQPVYFNDRQLGDNKGFQFLTTLSTQFLGLGIAGLAREYIVYPSSMLWPLNLAKVSLFNALHGRKVDEQGRVMVQVASKLQSSEDTPATSVPTKDPPVNGWSVPMFRFCLYAAIGGFCWLWITAMLLPFLTYFNWPTWIAPNNNKLAIVMGTLSGYGLNPVPTFDWTYINAAGLSPLITPWWATLSLLVGATIGLVIVIGLYFSNTWYTAYQMPNSNAAFDRFGAPYNITRILTPEKTLDVQAYEAYSPVYFGAGYNLVLGAFFANYTATILYALLNHWDGFKVGVQPALRQFRSFYRRLRRKPAVNESENTIRLDVDIHYLLMKRYPEVPQWWFLIIAAIAIVMGLIGAEVYDTGLPAWSVFFCLALSFLFLIPAGVIQALSISLVVLAQIIPGVAIPGRPYANMLFKMYGWISLALALLYVQDQKLAHYMHLPPRATYRTQIWGVLLSSLVSLGVWNWQVHAVPDLCQPGQKDLLTCPYYTTFYSSAILFGVVGPTRMYGSNGLYKYLMFSFLVGAGLTVLAWAVKKKFPNKITNSINVPVIISGAMFFAPYNWSFIWAGVPLAWFFMSYIYKRYHGWWNKYCYLLSIGLTVGVALSGVVQFFCVTYPGGKIPLWWGNTFYATGCDGRGCPLKPLPESGYFGPAPGDYK